MIFLIYKIRCINFSANFSLFRFALLKIPNKETRVKCLGAISCFPLPVRHAITINRYDRRSPRAFTRVCLSMFTRLAIGPFLVRNTMQVILAWIPRNEIQIPPQNGCQKSNLNQNLNNRKYD